MRKYISIFHWPLFFGAYLMIFGLVSCSDDEAWSGKEDIPERDGIGTLQVKMDIASMSATDDLESKINVVRIVGFSSVDGSLKFNYLYPNKENSDPTDILQQVTTGYTDLCIIVNETPEMSKTLGSVSIVEEVRTHVLSLNNFNLFANKDSLTKYGLPMYKEYLGLPIKVVHTKSNPYSLEAEVERIMAKLTLRITNFTHKEVTLDSIKILSLPEKSWLYPAGYADETVASTVVKLVSLSDSTYSDVNLYLPEYVLTDLSKRSILNLKGTAKLSDSVSDTIQCNYTISLGHGLSKFNKESSVEKYLAENKLFKEDFNIVRNTHYNITVSDIKGYENDKLTFLVGVNPWINVKENAYEGGTWRQQPVSQRIPINGSTSFTTKFIHTNAPYIVYNWYRSQYKQTETEKEPASPTIELLKSEILKNGESSVLEFVGALPTQSGEIYCEAAPIGGQHFRKSNPVTLMVIGDWDGGGQDIFPIIQNWIPKTDMPLGASYLLRDTRDNKIYRTKRMADGNWWMIQDLSFGDASSLEDFWNNGQSTRPTNLLANGLYGVGCSTNSNYGGMLYNSFAAVQRDANWPLSQDDMPSVSDVLGICPLGWHLPGNKDNEWNKEWIILENKVGGWSLVTMEKYDYYDSSALNCYTTDVYFDATVYNPFDNDKLEDSKSTIYYHGGIATTVRNQYWSIGFGFNENPLDISNKGAYTYIEKGQIFPTDNGYLIRCVKNNDK